MRRKLLAAVRTAIGVPLFFLFTLGLAAFLILMALLRPHHPVLDRIIRFWARRFMGVAPVKLEVEGRHRVDPDKQYVFVSNHLSNFDIPVLFAAVPHRIRYLSKKEVYKIPVVASAMKAVGIVKVDRAAGSSAHASINRGIAEARSHGYSLIIFPEGTRSRDGDFHGFKKGAFRIAISNQMEVVPVTIHGTWEVWQPGAKIFYPGTARVVIHDPISVDGLDLTSIGDLRDRVHEVVEKTWEELRASPP
jgi:1-acyl-sn-glycerol-3-phosphate acyltransferase